jgi:hypothetical protein
MVDVIDFPGDENVKGKPDSPLYLVCFSKTQVFSSFERTVLLLKVGGHEAALGSQACELWGGVYHYRPITDEEKQQIIEAVRPHQ